MNNAFEIDKAPQDADYIRGFVLDQFSDIEIWINRFISLSYIVRRDPIALTEEVLMSEKGGFGMRLDVCLKNISSHKLMSKKEADQFKEHLLMLSGIRNYFAHTCLIRKTQSSDGRPLYMNRSSLIRETDIQEKYQEFQVVLHQSAASRTMVINWVKQVGIPKVWPDIKAVNSY